MTANIKEISQFQAGSNCKWRFFQREKEDRGDRQRQDKSSPIEMLESLKKKVHEKLDAGEITEERAEELDNKLEELKSEIEEFNSLSLSEKKEKLIAEKEKVLNEKVEANRIPQEKADKIMEKYRNEINNWDGKSYPDFLKRYFLKKLHQ